MEFDTRGIKRKFRDSAKRHNLREIHERQYRKDQRHAQAHFEPEYEIENDDSEKFLKKIREFEEKQYRASEKNKIYEEEMQKCMPQPRRKGK